MPSDSKTSTSGGRRSPAKTRKRRASTPTPVGMSPSPDPTSTGSADSGSTTSTSGAPSRLEERYDLRIVADCRGLISGRLIQNPNYRGQLHERTGMVVNPDWQPSPKARDNEYVFYHNLRESVRQHGVQNPVCGFAFEDGIFIKTGISRLWAGLMEDRPVPCIFVDHDGVLQEFDRVTDLDECFTCERTDHEHPVLGWYYTGLAERVKMDDPRWLTGDKAPF